MSYHETSSHRSDGSRSRNGQGQSYFNPHSSSQHNAQRQPAEPAQANGVPRQQHPQYASQQFHPPQQNQQYTTPPTQQTDYVSVNRSYASRDAEYRRLQRNNPESVNPYTQQALFYASASASQTPPYFYPPRNPGYGTYQNPGQPTHPLPGQSNTQPMPLSTQNLQDYGQRYPTASNSRAQSYAGDHIEPFNAVGSIRRDGEVFDHQVQTYEYEDGEYAEEEEEAPFETDPEETCWSEEYQSQPQYRSRYR
ncbi:hypothetical protein IQ07DRAFT_431182 [Pyrenochaeta sp. DS3sAY3a]|nr:hypothetical protein IQ07DRAFT_431182 [Pyrenochaeta sp. DS3sAY3a]